VGNVFRSAGSTKLDATGAGQVTIAATGPGWTVRHLSINTSTAVKEPTFRLYLDLVSPTSLLEGSYSGSQDSSDTVHTVQGGQLLIGVWAGGDAGAVATMLVSGETGT